MRGPDGIRTRDLHLDRVASTARLLHGTLCGSSYRTPNGIRTRVSALKGRDPRPLDDGGPTAPGPGGRAREYSRDALPTRPGGVGSRLVTGRRQRTAVALAVAAAIVAGAACTSTAPAATAPSTSASNPASTSRSDPYEQDFT